MTGEDFSACLLIENYPPSQVPKSPPFYQPKGAAADYDLEQVIES